MERWHREQHLMFARWKMEMGIHGYDWRKPPTDPAACHCAAGIGSMRKRTPFDCGNPKCGVCHWGKFWEPKRRQNRRRAAIEAELASSDFTLTY